MLGFCYCGIKMTRKLLLIIFMCITVCAFSQEAQDDDSILPEQSGYILIISSYTYGEEWSTYLAKSIRTKLELEAPETTIHIAYAGIGNRNSFLSERFAVQKSFIFSKDKDDIMIPSVVVLIGEESWMVYRLMNHKGIWDKIPVVLCGASSQVVRDYPAYFGNKVLADSLMMPLEESKEKLPITAFITQDNEQATVGLMQKLVPSLKEVVFISTDNYQDKYALLKLQEAIATHFPEIALKVWHGDKKSTLSINKQIGTLLPSSAILVNSYVPENPPQHIPIFTLLDQQPKGASVVGGVYPLLDDYASQTTNAVLKLHHETAVQHFPFEYANNVVNLNKEAIAHFDMKRKASAISDVTYTNIPPTFLRQHYRLIIAIGLISIIAFFFVKLGRHIRSFRKQTVASFDRYKKLYEEYTAVYENMPIAVLVFDNSGHLINCNPNSTFFFNLALEKNDTFHLFENSVFHEDFKDAIRKGKGVNEMMKFKGHYLRFIVKTILSDTGEQEYSMIILDNTEIQQTKEEKESIYDIFNFAMNASSIGVAEYNLVGNVGIATDAWFKAFFSERTSNFSQVHRYVIEEDAKKVMDFFNQIGNGHRNTFSDTIRVKKDNEIHWIRVLIQLIEYAPQKGKVICTELAVNIDQQKEREKEYAAALKKAQESDRIKNTFVANMSKEIRSHIEEIVTLSTKVPQTPLFHERVALLSKIHTHNDILLQYITETIDSSKAESSN